MPAVPERDVLLCGGVLRDCVVKLYGDFQEGVPLEQAITDAQGKSWFCTPAGTATPTVHT